ncbi:peroxiredoxin [candidate division KSB1 bacterium]|nr:peroxiredoxin [candidate division KSB1 bacterium]
MKKPFLFLVIVTLSGIFACRGTETETQPQAAKPPEIGDPAPQFEALDAQDQTWRSKDVIGKKNLVVYFYPVAMTGGCTTQACAYRDAQEDLENLDIEVVGISGDAVKNLQLFKQAHQLNFTLLSDKGGEIAKKYGVPLSDGGSIEKEIDGKTETLVRDVTTARWTFIIDKTGTIVYKNTSVDVQNDSNKVIEFLKSL